MKYRFLALILTLFFSPAVFSQKYIFENEPSWVKAVEIPQSSTFSKYSIASGYYLKLEDYQVNLDEDAHYTHEVINVVSYTGITNASQILVNYDTSYQKLIIHHLYIWRKGKKIDRTNDLSFEKMNNEYNLQNGIYSGKISAYDNLNDIRKEDLIDFAYTLVGSNPIFKKEKYLFIPLESTNPVDLYSVRILYSKDKNYTYKCVGYDTTTVSNNLIGNYREIEISNKDVKALKMEEGTPSWIIPYKYFTLSSIKSWKEVNTWAQEVFGLKKEPELESVFKEIFVGNETLDEKINKVIDYVQDDIRYMGIESGIGSFKPSAPDKVVKQRFGDCKDKSLLLVWLLKKIGISKAYPALVNVAMLYETDKLQPSNEIFNHCIVKFEHENKTYWVDPTITQQGGDYKNLAMVDYGRALVVGESLDTIPLMSPQNTKATTFIKEDLSVKSFTEPATLEITSSRNGIEADKKRNFLEQYTSEDISKSVTDDLKLIYPIVNKTDDIKIVDDIKSNIISTTYKYEIDGFWQDGDKMENKNAAGLWIFRFDPQNLRQFINESACIERKTDLALNYPLNMEFLYIFHFHKNMLILDDYKKIENEIFYFDQVVEQISSNSFQIRYKFNFKTPFVKADDFKKICEQTNEMAKKLPVIVYFKK